MTAISERRWGDRRAGRPAFHYPERRHGFDRRRPGRLAWYRDRPLVIAVVLAGFGLLNLLDLVFTRHLLDGGAEEINPIMAGLFEADFRLAALFKLGTTAAVITILWRMRRYRRILQVSLIALGGFVALVGYQGALLGSLS